MLSFGVFFFAGPDAQSLPYVGHRRCLSGSLRHLSAVMSLITHCVESIFSCLLSPHVGLQRQSFRGAHTCAPMHSYHSHILVLVQCTQSHKCAFLYSLPFFLIKSWTHGNYLLNVWWLYFGHKHPARANIMYAFIQRPELSECGKRDTYVLFVCFIL